MTRIAVVGMACRYPDASSPDELWENVLSGRRAFRRIPDSRLNHDDYWDPDPAAADRMYTRTAALIEGYQFDRGAYRIAGSTYRATDLTHWLALDVAALALADAGYPGAEGLPRQRTTVVVGNSLTGEFTRAGVMRLRWPYVRRTVAAALHAEGWPDERLAGFLESLEASYKDPFPPVDEDSLAGGLSNTIAGRICNHFDLGGGGYTVDGACSSSLLSVATACRALEAGEVDVAIAGGVDLSIDPFELVGFAKTGALSRTEMRVYDQRSDGFWPGEGCGMVVLMREDAALARGRAPYALVRGWGISSDGRGGITRPEVSGYRTMLRRAYRQAGFGIGTVPLFEGHGTGTAVGDRTELSALAASREAEPDPVPAVIGSIKAMIGHTKAAAGVAGLIKTAMALRERVQPPSVGCVEPHDLLREHAGGLRTLEGPRSWPAGLPLRGGVTAMGFGGINTHLVLEGPPQGQGQRRAGRPLVDFARSSQDCELLLLDGADRAELRSRLAELIDWLPELSYAQLTDLAAELQRRLRDLPYRAAAVVSSPEDAARRLSRLLEALDSGESALQDNGGRTALGQVTGRARIGFLFPGQGSGRGGANGVLRRRYVTAADGIPAPASGDGVATEVAQPRIVAGSLVGLKVLDDFGVRADLAIGHSLGELSALHWAGALDREALLRLAGLRGATMARLARPGAMAAVAAGPELVRRLIGTLPVVTAGYNAAEETVLAGDAESVAAVLRAAAAAGTPARPLRVSHAFHSPLMAPAAEEFRRVLAAERFGRPKGRVISTVTGEVLPSDTDVRHLLYRQFAAPVLFTRALELAAKDVDLFVEVGPGTVLTGLAGRAGDLPAVALDTDERSLAALLRVLAACWVAGAGVDHEQLFEGRLSKPLTLGAPQSFFTSPCEQAPLLGALQAPAQAPGAGGRPVVAGAGGASSMEVLRTLLAERVELSAELVRDDVRVLDDLHLSSITVGQVVNQAARQLGVSFAQPPTNFATATLAELADLLRDTGTQPARTEVAGATAWSRGYAVELEPVPLPPAGEPEPVVPWQLYGEAGQPARSLLQALSVAPLGGGALVCLPAAGPDGQPGQAVAAALEAARAVLAGRHGERFVLVQRGGPGAAALARTLRQEAPQLKVTVVHLGPASIQQEINQVIEEVAATTGFSEAHYDGPGGIRRVPTLRVLPVRAARPERLLGPDDVLLVSGGGKGITAECARELARDGTRLAILGRSDPRSDPELAANLGRLSEAGCTVRYARADVTDPAQVRAAVGELTSRLGPVTAVLHGAGVNEPAPLPELEIAAFERTAAPKLAGLAALLAAVRPDRLKLLVTLGSIIGRAGLKGEAHYAVANDWLAAASRKLAEELPGCRVRCLEWSVWAGVGMGERLSVVESLAREGISAIPTEDGVRLLRRLVDDPGAPTVAVVSGRTGALDTVRLPRPELPLQRFLDRPLVRYDGAELVTEVELNAGSDPYLADHELDGTLLFPAVLGLEAMSQVAAAAAGRQQVPALERVEFLRPILVPPGGSTTIRIAAVVVEDDTVEAAIRSAETDFSADHFRAVVRFGPRPAVAVAAPEPFRAGLPPVALDPATELYGGVLFQSGRFRRLQRYHRVAARQADADVLTADAGWFAAFLPGELLLGDPGMRDVLMHGLQVCIPDATLLPVAVERIEAPTRRPAGTELRISARELSQEQDSYTYDVVARDAGGELVERWYGLRLRAVRRRDGRGPWPPALLGPYLQRQLESRLGAGVTVLAEAADGTAAAGSRRDRTELALARLLGGRLRVRHRPDGRPEVPGGPPVSVSHLPALTLCVTASGRVACDAERVVSRDDGDWTALLGRHAPLADLLQVELGEDRDAARTRVWAAFECLRKAGLPADAPLVHELAGDSGWAVLASGRYRVASLVTRVLGTAGPVVLAVLVEGM